MDSKIMQLNEKITKLKIKKRIIEEERIFRLGSLVLETSDRNDIDLAFLSGIILDAPSILENNPNQKEVWQHAGENFLGILAIASKNQTTQSITTASSL